MATFLVRSRRGCVGWLAAFAFIAHLTVADKSNNRYCDSKLGQYDEKCSSSDAAPAAGRGEPRLDRAPAAKQQRTGSSQGSAWGDVWGSKPLRWMWGTPVYSAQLQLSDADRDELVRLITTQYFRIEDVLSSNGELSPAEINDEFYSWQQDLDGNWMSTREDCLRYHRLSMDGPPPGGGESAADQQARQSCEDEAQTRHWPELRKTGAYKRLYQELGELCQAYLRELNLFDREARGSFEFDADGNELIWTWASVHHDGIEHFIHDHPASLLSGTLYLQVPQDSGWLTLQDPRESRKGTPIYNVDLLFERWGGLVPEGSTGMTELLKLSAAIALLHFDLALLTVVLGCCGCARLKELSTVVSLVAATLSLLVVGFLLWLMSSTEFDDDIDFPFGGKYGVEPSNGRVVIFPGWLLHQVKPSHVPSDTPRVAISFNIRGVWSPTGSVLSDALFEDDLS